MVRRLGTLPRNWIVRVLVATLLFAAAASTVKVQAAVNDGGGTMSGAPAPTATSAPDAANTSASSDAPIQAKNDGAETGDEEDGVSYNENSGGGGGKNNIRIVNRKDNRLRVKGRVQLNQIPGQNVAPVNLAYAYASCTDCQTFAVALQINLISRNASKVTPENAAIAVNYECTRCYTVARAYQYVYSVDDPMQVPEEVTELIKELNKELKSIHQDKNIALADAEARINSVISRFAALASSLKESRDEERSASSPDVTPIPETTATPDAATTAATPTAQTASDGTATVAPEASVVAPVDPATTPAAATPTVPAAQAAAASPTITSATPTVLSATATITASMTPTVAP